MVQDVTTEVNSSERRRIDERRARLRREKESAINELTAEYGPVKFGEPDPDEPTMIIDNFLTYSSPGGIGALEKGRKSLLATEIAVCLSSEEPSFLLGYQGFRISDQHNVTYLNYEGTTSEFQDRTLRIENARGIRHDDSRLHVFNQFPKLDTDVGLSKLDKILHLVGDGLLVIDPLYQALGKTDLNSLAAMGSCLSDIHTVCSDNFVTPLYVHHFAKGRGSGLDAFSGAGLKEHLGQWILLHKASQFNPSCCQQRFRMEIGSRAGFGGRYKLDVTEGNYSDPGGRYWETSVALASGPVADAEVSRGSPRLVQSVLECVTANAGITKARLRKDTKRSPADVNKALETLVSEGKIEGRDVVVRGNATTAYHALD